VLFFPDRRAPLDFVNSVARGGIGGVTVSGAHHDQHARLAQLQQPHAVLNAAVTHVEALQHFRFDLAQHLFGQADVCFVGHGPHWPPVVVIAHRAIEDHQRATGRVFRFL